MKQKLKLIILTLIFLCASIPTFAVESNAFSQKAKAVSQKDGFSAMMLVSDEKSVAELQKPSHETPTITAVEKFKRGEPAVISFVFSGMQLDKDSFCDITFDLSLHTVDGKVYHDMVLTDKEALKAKLNGNAGVFNNKESTTITFEKTDPAGKYIIKAKLKDNIGGRSIDFAKIIELVD